MRLTRPIGDADQAVLGIEQAVQVDDEIAHLRIVHGRLRPGLPGRVGGGVVREDSDDIELGQILEIVRNRGLSSSPPKTR